MYKPDWSIRARTHMPFDGARIQPVAHRKQRRTAGRKRRQVSRRAAAPGFGPKGKPRQRLLDKTQIVERMIKFTKTVPDDWSAHEKIAAEPQGLAIHALNLDIDVGPLLQTQKLLDSVVFAKNRQYPKALTAAELEMMNLTGDGNGLDMISLPPEMRDQVPTSNFFQRGGYDRNPVASRNPTVAQLIAATNAVMDRESSLQGAKTLGSFYDRVRPGKR